MKFLVTGLGNPGKEYEGNRHNAGFMVVDRIAADKKEIFQQDRHGETCVIKHKGRQIILLKPNTYMNLSGKAVRYHLDKNGIELSNLLVITDDIAIPLGKVRLRIKGGAGGHNGLKSIEELFGENYARLRIGVGGGYQKSAQADYVLSDFSSEEMKEMEPCFEKAMQCVYAIATVGFDKAMTEFNK